MLPITRAGRPLKGFGGGKRTYVEIKCKCGKSLKPTGRKEPMATCNKCRRQH